MENDDEERRSMVIFGIKSTRGDEIGSVVKNEDHARVTRR